MFYENFITKLLNIKPSDLLSVISSSAKDGSIILKVRLKPKECYCHICNIPGKTHGYYQRKLLTQLSLIANVLLYTSSAGTSALNAVLPSVSAIRLLILVKESLMKLKSMY